MPTAEVRDPGGLGNCINVGIESDLLYIRKSFMKSDLDKHAQY